ncbi:unnamed protein product [Caenorhabditis bovis]|uniref:Uncharacterized protein n=1 Tax=Caenorhabditis bovis TaxID=2654633 RepID=A0A8S1E9L3_9PELO|nr:unnamed protein product [Caenorhabditis bovis]
MSNDTLADLFPYVYKHLDDRIHKYDSTGWDVIFEPTYTSTHHSDRLILEWSIDTLSMVIDFYFCIFLWNRKQLMILYADTVTFVTFASFSLYLPFYLLSTWQTMYLLVGKPPEYSTILHCTVIRHMVLACFQSAQLIVMPVAVNQIAMVIRKKAMGFSNMVFLQIGITFLEMTRLLGHIAMGDVMISDMCTRWIFSKTVFLAYLIISHLLRIFTVLISIFNVFYWFRKAQDNRLKRRSKHKSVVVLIQSLIPLLLPFPLVIRQIYVIIEGHQVNNFVSQYGYMAIDWISDELVDHICPSLNACFAYYYAENVTETDTKLFTSKGCLEHAMEESYENAPPCETVDFEKLDLSEEQMMSGFKCVCKKRISMSIATNYNSFSFSSSH